MTTAHELTKAHGGDWSGSFGLVPGPGHSTKDRSLKVWDGDDGVKVHSFAGDDWRECRTYLHLDNTQDWVPPIPARPTPRPAQQQNNETARTIWDATRSGTLAETYLKNRSLSPPWPAALRFHSNLKHWPTGLFFPALVAGVQSGTGQFQAIHRTYLLPDGRDKAPVSTPKMALGSLGDGAVRLGEAGMALGLSEGVETGLSAQQMFKIPVWAVLGARYDGVTVPSQVSEIQLFADNGKAGEEAAHKAAGIFAAVGKRVFIRRPPAQFDDWNSALPHWQKRGSQDWEF